MEDVISILTIFISAIGAIIVVYGAFLASYLFIKNLLKNYHAAETLNIDHVRLVFGRYIVLGLEFFIAADIIETIFVPTWEEMGLLAGLVILRTILSVFLTRELEKLTAAERKKLR